jgi:hypothetical protein
MDGKPHYRRHPRTTMAGRRPLRRRHECRVRRGPRASRIHGVHRAPMTFATGASIRNAFPTPTYEPTPNPRGVTRDDHPASRAGVTDGSSARAAHPEARASDPTGRAVLGRPVGRTPESRVDASPRRRRRPGFAP